jgi:plasmid maintenance system antidote protein VapI
MNSTTFVPDGKKHIDFFPGEHRRHEDIGPVVIFGIEGRKDSLVAVELDHHGRPVGVYDVETLDQLGWSKPRRSPGSITEEEIEQARQLKRFGKSERSIAALLGMSRAKVNRLVHSVKKESIEKQVQVKLCDADRKKVQRLLSRGWTHQTIAELMGVCNETIRRIADIEREKRNV